jgi:predicted nucleic acid-binding protein
MMVIDTDILSMFGKIDAVDLIVQLFSAQAVMTPRIRDELAAPLEYGYTFPLKALAKIRTVSLGAQALDEYARFQGELSLGKGELEAIAYCKTAQCGFATNDEKARELARREDVPVISLQAILKALWKKGITSKGEVKQILERIKEVDNLVVSRAVEATIFED